MYFKVKLKGGRISVEVIYKDKMELKEYYNAIDCSMIEITSLSEDVAIVSDEEALMKSNNPVFKVGNLDIPGTFLIGKDVMTDEGMEVRGFDSLEEVKDTLSKVQVTLIGMTA